MPIPTTGSVSLSTIQTEFGGNDPINLSEYYKADTNVPNTALNTSIPLSGAITIGNFRGGSKATFSILPNTTNVNEGSTVTFTVSTTDYGSGTLYWTLSSISGTITNADFSSPANVLSGGSVSITNNVGTINLTLANDANTDGIDSFALLLRVNSLTGTIVATSSTVTVADTSLTQTFLLSRSVASVTEGNSFVITLTTTNVPDGTTIPYTIGGMDAADIDVPLTGSFTVQNNTASLTVTANVNADTNSTAFVLGRTSGFVDCVRQYAVSTDLQAGSLVNTLNLSSVSGYQNGAGMYFRYDGKVFFVQDPGSDKFYRWVLGTNWDISTAGTPTNAAYGSTGTNHQGMWINEAGTTLFHVDRTLGIIFQDTLSQFWNPMNPGQQERNKSMVNDGITQPTGIAVKPDGTRAFVSTLSPVRTIAEYTGPAYNCNSWVLNTTIQTPSNSFNTDVFVNNEGTKMYVTDDGAKIHYYTLGTAWSLATASYVRTWTIPDMIQATASYIYIDSLASEVFVLTLNNGASSVAVSVLD